MRVLLLLAFVVFAAAHLAPLLNVNSLTKIENQYIVILQENSTEAQRDASIANLLAFDDGILLATYHIDSFIGYSVRLSDEALMVARQDPLVSYVEYDQEMHHMQTTVQPNCPNWGPPSTSGAAQWNGAASYRYPTHGASGVDIYVIDTGVLCSHNDLSGRCTLGASFVGGTAEDCNGHGTHVASSAAGTVCGIAKRANIIAVRVLNCQGSGTNQGVISGVDWTANRHTNARKSVANMSLGGGMSAALNQAVAAGVRKGVLFAVAAGNSNNDACTGSPSSEPLATTVGASARSTNRDVRASFSSWGRCLNIFSPGENIYGAWIGAGGNTFRTISGTSMASPHVAGQAALYMYESSVSGPGIVDAVKTQLSNTGHHEIIDLRCTSNPCFQSPNVLLHNGLIGDDS
jgi:subtilisin family serine protease